MATWLAVLKTKLSGGKAYYKVAVGLLAFLPACTSTKDTAMTDPLLDVRAKCRGNDRCVFQGHDLFLDISISNNQSTEIGFPLTYVRKAGPIVRLVDTRTKADTYLKGNLADPELLGRFTMIRPGESVSVEWVFTSAELRHFGGDFVDVSAEITVSAPIQVKGKLVDFRGTDTLHIVSERKN